MKFDVAISDSLLRQVALRRLFRNWRLTLFAYCLIGFAVLSGLWHRGLGIASIIGLTVIGFQVIIYATHYIRQRKSIADWRRLHPSRDDLLTTTFNRLAAQRPR